MNKIKTNYNSSIQLVNIFVNETTFKRKEVLKNKLKMNFEFEHIIKDIDETKFKLLLKGRVFSDDDSIEGTASVIGYFEFVGEMADTELKEHLKQINSVSIMFPYLRSQFTLISSQSDTPLVIPTININSYLEDKKKENKENKETESK